MENINKFTGRNREMARKIKKVAKQRDGRIAPWVTVDLAFKAP